MDIHNYYFGVCLCVRAHAFQCLYTLPVQVTKKTKPKKHHQPLDLPSSIEHRNKFQDTNTKSFTCLLFYIKCNAYSIHKNNLDSPCPLLDGWNYHWLEQYPAQSWLCLLVDGRDVGGILLIIELLGIHEVSVQ